MQYYRIFTLYRLHLKELLCIPPKYILRIFCSAVLPYIPLATCQLRLDHLYKGVSMTFKEMSALLRVYIDANYIQTDNTSAAAYVAEAEEGAEIPKGMDKESSDPYVKKEHFTLDQLMDEVGESFHEMLFLKPALTGSSFPKYEATRPITPGSRPYSHWQSRSN